MIVILGYDPSPQGLRAFAAATRDDPYTPAEEIQHWRDELGAAERRGDSAFAALCQTRLAGLGVSTR